MTSPSSNPMFAKEGKVMRNVSKMVFKFFALWISLKSLPSLKILNKEALLPTVETIPSLLKVNEVNEIQRIDESKRFQGSPKYEKPIQVSFIIASTTNTPIKI